MECVFFYCLFIDFILRCHINVNTVVMPRVKIRHLRSHKEIISILIRSCAS